MIKRITMIKYLTTVVVLLFVCSVSGNAQTHEREIEVQYAVDSASSAQAKDGAIHILDVIPSSDTQVLLYDKEPWNGGRLISDNSIFENNEYVIRGLKPGKYVVVIKNSEKNGSFETVNVPHR